MQKRLSIEAVQQYHRDGCYFPVPVLGREEAAHYRRCLEQHEAKTGNPLQGNWRHKTHLLFTWADELVHHPKILDAIEDVIGPDILCWTTNFFIKEANNPGFVSWHQDSTYWGLDPDDVITAWVAFTDATPENGYMQFMPGSNDRRIGLAIRYIPTYVRQTKVRDSAMLVRGTDKYHHFDDEPRPRADLDEAAFAAHADAVARQVKALYQGTDKQEFRA